jgi:hypothetical protein
MNINIVQFKCDVEKATINKSVSKHLKNIFSDVLILKNSFLQISQGKTLKKFEANKQL